MTYSGFRDLHPEWEGLSAVEQEAWVRVAATARALDQDLLIEVVSPWQ
jgi:hypothetical protein